MKARRLLEVGDLISMESLLRDLPELGYVQVDRVEETGEFSTHGEMIDLFLAEFEKPLRLGWRKDRLYTIQHFQIDTQLTDTAELESVNILPVREVLYSERQAVCSTTANQIPRSSCREPAATHAQTTAGCGVLPWHGIVNSFVL